MSQQSLQHKPKQIHWFESLGEVLILSILSAPIITILDATKHFDQNKHDLFYMNIETRPLSDTASKKSPKFFHIMESQH